MSSHTSFPSAALPRKFMLECISAQNAGGTAARSSHSSYAHRVQTTCKNVSHEPHGPKHSYPWTARCHRSNQLGGEGLGRKLVKVPPRKSFRQHGINYAEGQAQQVVSPFSGAGANIDVAFLLAMCWCVALLCGVLASSGGLFFETHDTTTDVALTRGTCPTQL